MKLDQFFCMHMQLFPNDDPRIPEWCSTWSAPSNWKRYDRFTLSGAEVEKLVDQLEDMSYGGSDLIVQPALPEFTLLIAEPQRVEHTLICFRKTILPPSFVEHGEKGAKIIKEPIIDAYVHINNAGDSTDMVLTMGRTTVMIEGKKPLTMSFSVPVWAREGTPMISEDQQENMEIYRDMKLIYLAIQKALYDRPTVFRESTPRPSTESTGEISAHRHSRRRKAKAIRVLCIDPDELEKMVQTGVSEARHPFHCPCWGVIGHWRTYKSGKRVWIQPYTKGQERNNPNRYQAKEYELMEEQPHA